MAIPVLSQFKSPVRKLSLPSPSLKAPKRSSYLSLPSNSLGPASGVSFHLLPFSCSFGYGDNQNDQKTYSRPSEIRWSKDLANSVHLIGNIGASVQIKQLSSGKVLAWTRLGVKKSSSETSWINLTFWDELAQVAFQHVEKGNQVYVLGRLVSDVTEGENDKPLVFFKVVVQQLNFIEKSFPPASVHEEGTDLKNSSPKSENYTADGFYSASTEGLWQAFFVNPVDWWDNRKNKRNSRYPDFKHKHTGEALWIEGKNSPAWVKGQLAILDERVGSSQSLAENSMASWTDFTSF